MQKKPASKGVRLEVRDRQVRKDVIDFVIGLLQSEGFRFELASGDFIFESIDELQKQCGANPAELEIKAKPADPTVQNSANELKVSFSRDVATVWAWGEQEKLAAREIEERLRGLPLRVPSALSPLGPLYWPWLACGILVWVPALPRAAQIGFASAWFLISGLMLIGSLMRRFRPGIVLMHQHEGFFSRNWEKLVLLLLGAMAAEAIRFISAKLVQ